MGNVDRAGNLLVAEQAADWQATTTGTSATLTLTKAAPTGAARHYVCGILISASGADGTWTLKGGTTTLLQAANVAGVVSIVFAVPLVLAALAKAELAVADGSTDTFSLSMWGFTR